MEQMHGTSVEIVYTLSEVNLNNLSSKELWNLREREIWLLLKLTFMQDWGHTYALHNYFPVETIISQSEYLITTISCM